MRNPAKPQSCGPPRELLRIVTALAHPVLPDSTAKAWKLLGQATAIGATSLDGLRWGQLTPAISLGKFQALFPRVEKTEAIERIEAMANEELNLTQAAPAAAPATTAMLVRELERLP